MHKKYNIGIRGLPQNGTKWYNMAQNDIKWHKMAQNGIKLHKMAQNCIKIVKKIALIHKNVCL
jgi:hypothetical protein